MSATITEPNRHIAAGNGFAIGQYIEEMQAQGYSPTRITQTLEREGLALPALRSQPVSCQQVEAALVRQDYLGAVFAARALKAARTREGYHTQMSCLRMRLEYHHGQQADVVKLLAGVRRSVG